MHRAAAITLKIWYVYYLAALAPCLHSTNRAGPSLSLLPVQLQPTHGCAQTHARCLFVSKKKQSQIVNIFTPCSLESHTSILQAAAYRICLILIGKGKNVFLITSYYFSSSKIQHSPKHICLLFPNSSFILINVKEACKYDRRITKWQNVTESSEQTKRKLHIQIE